jgi:endonuclease/exonuclease/phosphatase family metal-dependent hydrolase
MVGRGVRIASLLVVSALALLPGCDLFEEATQDPVDAGPGDGDGGPDAYPAPHDNVVPAVGSAATLDIACWNIENFPATPETPALVADLITSLDLDLIVVEEIANVAAFDELVARLPEHEAILSSHQYSSTSYQKVGLIYRSSIATVGPSELLFGSDTWGFPRPLLKVPVTVGTFTFDVIGLHLKAGGAPEDAERRTVAARTMDSYLRAQIAGGGEDEVIVLGDYNEQINTGGGQTVLAPLLAADQYSFRDAAAVAAGEYSFVPSGRVIDHILTTAGLDAEAAGAIAIIPHLDQQYPRYESLVSDHLPVVLSLPMP